MKTIVITLLVTLTLFSCVRDARIDYPEPRIEYVLNGILHPDSLIKIEVSQSRGLQDTINQIVADASVLFYENDVVLEQANYLGDGIYQINKKPQENYHYRVEVQLADGKILSAEDRIPQKLEVTYFLPPKSSSSGRDLDLSIFGETQNTITWVYFSLDTFRRNSPEPCGDTTKLITKQQTIASRDPRMDNFNASFDNSSKDFDYFKYARISKYLENKIDITFRFSINFCSSAYNDLENMEDPERFYTVVLNTSEHYDRYLKSSLQHFLLNEEFETPDPFSEPVRIYSNVEGGLGIFAAYNSTKIHIQK